MGQNSTVVRDTGFYEWLVSRFVVSDYSASFPCMTRRTSSTRVPAAVIASWVWQNHAPCTAKGQIVVLIS